MKSRFLLATLLLVVFLPISAAFAQQNTMEQYTSPNGAFTFQYPDDWRLIASSDEFQNVPILLHTPSGKSWDDYVSIFIVYPYQASDADKARGGKTPLEIIKWEIAARGMPNDQSSGSIQFATRLPNTLTTPQPFQLAPSPVPPSPHPSTLAGKIVEFQVNGRPAARTIPLEITVLQKKSATIFIAADLGNDYLVFISASADEMALLRSYESQLLAVVNSMRFTPPKPVNSGNPDLPQVYSGPIGVWRQGTVKFFYPAGWTVTYFVTPILMNTGTLKPGNNEPAPGQVFVMLGGPAELLSSVKEEAARNPCYQSKLTAKEAAEKLLSGMTPAQLQQMKDAGITMSQPESLTFNGKTLVLMRQKQGGFETLVVLIDLGKGNIPVLNVFARSEDMPKFEKTIYAIAATFEYTPQPCTPDGTPIYPTQTPTRTPKPTS